MLDSWTAAVARELAYIQRIAARQHDAAASNGGGMALAGCRHTSHTGGAVAGGRAGNARTAEGEVAQEPEQHVLTVDGPGLASGNPCLAPTLDCTSLRTPAG
jgi:hypothetical protein